MRDHTARRAMPVEQSILWKPLHDPHYVVASLQPADGGRRKIFIRQQALGRVESLVRAHGRRVIGLLLGHFYRCSETGAEYLVIESIAELDAVSDETAIAPSIAEALAKRSTRQHGIALSTDDDAHVLGWYRGEAVVGDKPSLTTAGVHATLFTQPWQLSLVVGEGSKRSGGALFLHDTVNSRWFYAPFYEILTHVPAANEPKPTLVDWPQYMTADSVAAATREAAVSAESRPVQQKKPYERPWLRRSSTKDDGPRRSSSDSLPLPPKSVSASPVGPLDQVAERVVDTAGEAEPRSTDHSVAGGAERNMPGVERSQADRPPTDRPAPRAFHNGLADVPRLSRDRPRSRRIGSGEKLSIVDDRDQRTAAPPSRFRVSDDDDTVMSDDPGRYIEIARHEGFFIAGRFDTGNEQGRAESVWVLNEPYSGMLLAIVATDSDVIDATLHYNLQTDDAGLMTTPFPEHRDPESKTIYVRENCTEGLRARCRALRATNALLREWKVTPPIWFLTPAEWESMPPPGSAEADDGGHVASALNRTRIAELPPGGRSQFRLPDGEASA